MTTRRLAPDAEGLDAAASAIEAGEPIVVPTDTVYGLAVKAGEPDALDRVFELKRRPVDRSIAVLVSDLDQALGLAELSEPARAAASRWWPGALTLVLDRHPQVDPSVGRDDGTVGIRCPDDPFVRRLAARVGPLATTSANRSGEPTAATADEAAASLDGEVAVVIDAGPRVGEASTVARLDPDGTVVVFRQGPVVVSLG